MYKKGKISCPGRKATKNVGRTERTGGKQEEGEKKQSEAT